MPPAPSHPRALDLRPTSAAQVADLLGSRPGSTVLQLGRILRGLPGPGRPARPLRRRPPQRLDRGPGGAAAGRPGRSGPTSWATRDELDGPPAPRAPVRRRRPVAVRRHHPPPTATGSGYVWKRSRYVLPPDPEREKNAPSGGGCGPCRRGASSWLRTRPTCGCSRRWRPAGPGAATRPRCRSAGATPSGSCSGRSTSRPGSRLFLARRAAARGGLRGVPGARSASTTGAGTWRLLLDEDSSHTAEDSQDAGRRLGDRVAVAAQAEPAPEPDGPPVAARQGGRCRRTISMPPSTSRWSGSSATWAAYPAHEALTKAGICLRNFWLRP